MSISPEMLVVARIRDEGSGYPLDRFVGIPGYPWKTPQTLELLVRSTSTLVNQQVVTCFGETVTADLCGVIFTRFLGVPTQPCADVVEASGSIVLRDHLNPRRLVRPASPELFTWSSAFNSAKDTWPGVAGVDQLMTLGVEGQASSANHFLGYGLEALAAEAANRYVRLASSRLLAKCEAGQVDLHVVRYPGEALRKLGQRGGVAARVVLPEPHGLAYFPACASERSRRNATILVPLHWIACALNREIVALTHLVRVASLARDDYFGRFSGRDVAFSRELGLMADVSQFDVACTRADRLAATFLAEAAHFDNRVYGLQINRDEYCRTIERQSARAGFYDDPPEPRTHQGTGIPGTNG